LEFLKAHHCDEAQGYYFSRPVPAEQFAKLLKTSIPEANYIPHRGGPSIAAEQTRNAPKTDAAKRLESRTTAESGGS